MKLHVLMKKVSRDNWEAVKSSFSPAEIAELKAKLISNKQAIKEHLRVRHFVFESAFNNNVFKCAFNYEIAKDRTLDVSNVTIESVLMDNLNKDVNHNYLRIRHLSETKHVTVYLVANDAAHAFNKVVDMFDSNHFYNFIHHNTKRLENKVILTTQTQN